MAAELERALRDEPGILSVRASPRTATLLVLFDPELPRAAWETKLASLVGSAPECTAANTPRKSLRSPAKAGVSGRPQQRQEHAELEGHAPEEVPWHILDPSDVLAHLVSTHEGLTSEDATARLTSEGPNAIPAMPRRSELRIFADQLVSTPVAMLAVSSLLSAATGGLKDAAAIVSVVAINAGIGYYTESGAERTIASLTDLPHQTVPVLRDGSERELQIDDVVRGDVLLLRAGVFLAADARVLEASDLTVDESSLTGESIPAAKSAVTLGETRTPLADRHNMVYRGTLVTGGSGQAWVVATGERTEIGRIQALAGNVEQRETPMQRQLDQLGKQLAIGAGLACLGMLGIGLLRGHALLPLVRTAVSLGVAAVPEGLPTVAMSTLAIGLSRMRGEQILVRKLAAVETLGATQVVCLDKTGTLTLNRMTVVETHAGLRSQRVRDGEFREPTSDGVVDPSHDDVVRLLRVAALCNEVQLEHENGATTLRGSATESALMQLALDAGVNVQELRRRFPLHSVQRRAQSRNYMSTLHTPAGGPSLWALKGRPTEVLALCTKVARDGRLHPLTDRERSHIELENERMAGRALRVLGFAMGDAAAGQAGEKTPHELAWVGLVGMEDPPRPGVNEVLARLHRAGVKTVMITGDQSATAQAVGRQIGLADSERLEIVDSTRLDAVPSEVLGSLAQRADIFSRVSPAHKLHIVRALQRANLVVAMTGDGVNDGPALKAADIGVAMGAGGSTAARELADVVLEQDDLGALILALEQGRTIYDDIRKAVRFILTTNLGELLFTITAVAGGAREPLTPLQLLWINLMTDIFPELALASQPPEADLLSRPPRDPGRPMFTSSDLWRMAIESSVMTAGVMANYYSAARSSGQGRRASSLAFTTLMFSQLLHAFSVRSEVHGIFERERIATNRWLPIAVGATALIQLAAGLVPPLRAALGIVPLRIGDWGKVAAAAFGSFFFNEGLKLTRHLSQASSLAAPTQHLLAAEE